MLGESAAIVVTSCGKRKCIAPDPQLRAETLPIGELSSVAAIWTARVKAASRRTRAVELYQGRAFREAEGAAAPINASLYVISAGLGIVPADHQIPSYSLTVAPGSDNILARLDPWPRVRASHWWQVIAKGSETSFAALIEETRGPLLIAAGASYLNMIADDLVRLPASGRNRLRLFAAACPEDLPTSLRGAFMPYDRRLEGLAGRAGTLADFAQRAVRHFTETILCNARDAGAVEHSAAVLRALDGIAAPAKKRGKSLSDEEIVAIIRANWNASGGKSAATLRLLRDSFQVACEQKRFKKLFELARLDQVA